MDKHNVSTIDRANILWQIFTYMILLLVLVVAVFPGIWMISTAIKTPMEQFVNPPRIIPENPIIDNFIRVFNTPVMFTAFVNSVLITASVVAITLLISILAGFGFSRFKFRGSGTLKIMLLFGQMIPGVVLIIPLYFMFVGWGLLDTQLSLVIANLALAIPMGVIMLGSFFDTIPRELEDAAKIDGCTGLSALFRVVVPIAKPGLIAVAIYTYINSWEEFLFALNLSISASTRTLPIAIHMFAGEFTVDWGATMAASTVVALPVLLIFLTCNKYFVRGLSEGAVKG